jgi:hypothetical protein
VLNWGLANKPILIIPVGLDFAVIYYFGFRWAIRRFDLPTPGRERDAVIADAAPAIGAPPSSSKIIRGPARLSDRQGLNVMHKSHLDGRRVPRTTLLASVGRQFSQERPQQLPGLIHR